MRQLSESTREAILSGATRLLASREFDRVTTRDIAGEAGVSEGTVFRYFEHKQAILRTILEDRGRHFFAELDEVMRLIDDPYEKLVALGRRHALFAARNHALLVVLHRDASFDRPPVHAEPLMRLLGSIRGILEDGVRRGLFRPELDIEVMAKTLHSVVFTLLFWQAVERTPDGLTEEVVLPKVDRHLRFLLDAWLVKPRSGR